MPKTNVTGPNGQPIQGFPFARDLAGYYSQLKSGRLEERDASFIRAGLERILKDEKTHQGNADTLRYVSVVQELLGGVAVTTPKKTLQAAPEKPKLTLDDALAKAYRDPSDLAIGTVARIKSLERPPAGKTDYSTRPVSGKRVFFVRGAKPQLGDFYEVTAETRMGQFYNARLLTKDEAARLLGVEIPSAASAQPKPTPRAEEPAKPKVDQAIVERLVRYTRDIDEFAKNVEATLTVIRTSRVEDKDLASSLKEARGNYRKARDVISDALDGAEYANQLDPNSAVRSQFFSAAVKLSGLDAQLNKEFLGLEQRAVAYEAAQKARGYDVKVPGAGKPEAGKKGPAEEASTKPEEKVDRTIRQYGLTIRLGKRTTTVVFPEASLPKTGRAFKMYLDDLTHFPDRKDREVVEEFLHLIRDGATVLYNGKRIGLEDRFETAFTDYKSVVTTENGETVRREAKRSEATASQGGKLGDLLYRMYLKT